MKVKVQKKLLRERINKLLTDGQMTSSGDRGSQIRLGFMFTKDKSLVFVGSNDAISCRTSIECEVVEPSEKEVIIPDFETLLECLDPKTTKGEFVEIFDEEGSLFLEDESGKSEFGLGNDPKVISRMKEWLKMITVVDGSPALQTETAVGKFIPWFDANGDLLNKIEDLAFRKINISGDVLYETNPETNTITISIDNKELRRSKVIKITDGKVHTKNAIELPIIYPILNSVKGLVNFYTYVTTKGVLRVWVKNGETDWMAGIDNLKK